MRTYEDHREKNEEERRENGQREKTKKEKTEAKPILRNKNNRERRVTRRGK